MGRKTAQPNGPTRFAIARCPQLSQFLSPKPSPIWCPNHHGQIQAKWGGYRYRVLRLRRESQTGANSEEDDVVGKGGDSQSTEDGRTFADADKDEADDPSVGTQIKRQVKARSREMQKMKKQRIKEILDAHNASIDAAMNNKWKGRLQYLLQQTVIFSHFAQGSHAASEKKPKGRGRHSSKVTEEEEDEEYLKEEEYDFVDAGGARLMAQPICIH